MFEARQQDGKQKVLNVSNQFQNNYPAESLTLLIVGDRSEDIQHGGVSPALVNLENKEIESVNMMSLITL